LLLFFLLKYCAANIYSTKTKMTTTFKSRSSSFSCHHSLMWWIWYFCFCIYLFEYIIFEFYSLSNALVSLYIWCYDYSFDSTLAKVRGFRLYNTFSYRLHLEPSSTTISFPMQLVVNHLLYSGLKQCQCSYFVEWFSIHEWFCIFDFSLNFGMKS